MAGLVIIRVYMALKDFLLNSDTPIEKVSSFLTGSLTVTAGATSFPTMLHGLSYRPIYYMRWSTTPSFDVSYDESSVSYFTGLTLNMATTSTAVKLFALNDTGSSVTFYYRIIFFMPVTLNLPAAPTALSLDDFAFSSDYNYPKIYQEGFTIGNNAVITHNLGYKPQVEVWHISPTGQLSRLIGSQVYPLDAMPPPDAEVTNTQLILNAWATTTTNWYYRIFVDEY